MTADQKKGLEKFIISQDTSDIEDLKRSINTEVLEVENIEEALLFSRAYRIAVANTPEQELGSDIRVSVSKQLQADMDLLAKGNRFFGNFQ